MNIKKTKESTFLRKKAEAQHQLNPFPTEIHHLSEADILKLIQELEVHRIELELQNEELLLAKNLAEEATAKYTELYDFAPSGYFTLSKEREIIDLNLRGAQTLGRNRSDLINRNFGLFVSRETRQVFNSCIEQAFATKKKESCEIILSTEWSYPVYILLTVILSENGEQYMINTIDITSQKHADEANRESERKYQLLAEHMTDFVWLMDMDLRVTFQSPSSEKMRGFTNEEMKILPIDQNLTPESLQLALERFYQEIPIILSDPSYNPIIKLDLEYYRKNGTTLWLENQFSIIRNSNGIPVSILGEGRDITARRQMELTLRENESRSRAFLDAIPDMIFMLNRDGVYLYYKAATEDLSYQSESIIGKRNRDIMPAEFADLIDEKIRLTLLGGPIQVFEYEIQIPVKGICIYEARMASSGTNEVIAIVRDITASRQVEAAIKLKNEQLSKLNAEKDKFFSIVAHDLRSPFNAFLGFTQMLVEDLNDFTLKEIQHIAVSMSNSATNLFNLLENLLEWSRMQRGLTSHNLEAFLVMAKIDETMQPVTESASKKSISIVYDIPASLSVFADANMFGSTIRNLSFNAVKFTPRGGKIQIRAKAADDNQIEISISDNGIGMSKSIMDKLFQIDQQTNRKGTEDEPSTGLGLILCKDFVEKHGGRIWVESEEGNGTTFYFCLPCKTN
jgi:PAS domain S-box-containing protein